MQLLRSALYVPGNNERAITKAASLDVDVIIFDLEDAVPLEEKQKARDRVCEVLATGGFGTRPVCVRVNDPGGSAGREDLLAVLEAGAKIVVVPKLDTARELVELSGLMDKMTVGPGAGDVKIWTMMETPRAILNAAEIARLAENGVPRLAAFVMGTNDLARQTGVHFSQTGPWIMNCVLAAKAFGLAILDGVYNDFRDETGLEAQCRLARQRGMDGKTLIHPAQIDICNQIFSPDRDEVRRAREIVALFEKPQNRNAAVAQINGRMVERLHYEMARELLQKHDLTLRRGKGTHET